MTMLLQYIHSNCRLLLFPCFPFIKFIPDAMFLDFSTSYNVSACKSAQLGFIGIRLCVAGLECDLLDIQGAIPGE